MIRSYCLAHVSDVHLPTNFKLHYRDIVSKRFFGFMNWQKRKHHYRRAVVDALVSDLSRTGYDHLAVTGDITNLALETEFSEARAWLESLNTNDRITFIPGNHDAYVHHALAKGLKHLRPWLDDGPYDGGFHFPSLRFRGPLALIGLSSAIETPPLMALGQIGVRQMTALGDLLTRLRDEGWIRVILIHHPPERKASRRFGRLIDSIPFLDLLKQVGAELVLSGHHHIFDIRELEGPGYAIPNNLVGAASLAKLEGAKRAGYGLIDFETVSGKIAMHIRHRAIRNKRFEWLGTHTFHVPSN